MAALLWRWRSARSPFGTHRPGPRRRCARACSPSPVGRPSPRACSSPVLATQALERTRAHLAQAEGAAHRRCAGARTLAEELRLAHDCSREITGRFSADDLLEKYSGASASASRRTGCEWTIVGTSLAHAQPAAARSGATDSRGRFRTERAVPRCSAGVRPPAERDAIARHPRRATPCAAGIANGIGCGAEEPWNSSVRAGSDAGVPAGPIARRPRSTSSQYLHHGTASTSGVSLTRPCVRCAAGARRAPCDRIPAGRCAVRTVGEARLRRGLDLDGEQLAARLDHEVHFLADRGAPVGELPRSTRASRQASRSFSTRFSRCAPGGR